MSKVHQIAKNTSYFTLALILQKVLSFTYFAIIARALGPEDLGKYYFAISFTSIFAIFIDFGLSNTQTREIAKNNSKAQEITSLVLAIKIPLLIVIYSFVAILVNLMHYPEITKNLVYLSGLCMVMDSLSLTFFSTIRGFHNLVIESISSVVFQIIVLCAGLYFLKIGWGNPVWLMAALVFASVYMSIYSGYFLWRKFGVKILPLYDFTLIKSLAYISLSFAVFAIFNKLYTYLDSVLLQFFAGDAAVGLYQIAFKIMFAIQFLPAAFTASLYPAFSHYWTNNRSQLTITFERAMIYLIIISLPIAVGIATIADKLIIVFKDSFKDAVVPLEIAMISLVFIFLNYPVGALLNACDKQKENTKFMGIVLVVNVILNLILIPRLGVSGACITVVITNILMFVLGMSVVHKIIDYNKVKLLLVFLKSFFASLVMGSLVIYLKEGMNIFAVVILAVSVYFVLVLSMGAVKKQDFNSIIKSFKKV